MAETPPRLPKFPIVGVGASAGGLEAFSELLSALPENCGIAVVFIQHLDPTHESMLSQILSRNTQLAVSEATDQTTVEPNHIYVIPANADLSIEAWRAAGRRSHLRTRGGRFFSSRAGRR